MTAYQTLSDARTLAATLPGLDRFHAADDATAAALLLLASVDVDQAHRYQGRKYDPSQEREFPRVDGPPVGPNWPADALPAGAGLPYWPWGGAGNIQIWDWDDSLNNGQGGATVPDLVKLAMLYQCEWLLQPKYAKRLEAIKSGLKGQNVGGVAETLADDTGDGLCDRASRYVQRYVLKSGRIL